jgi:DNA segregation ATPase FtsK/SpoIIIE, S-DNA-T family
MLRSTRDVERIKPLIEAVELLWQENPDWRFGQLITNIARPKHRNTEMFYLEDDVFLTKIDECVVRSRSIISDYQTPPIEILDNSDNEHRLHTEGMERRLTLNLIADILDQHSINYTGITGYVGPTITCFEIRFLSGIKVSQIENLKSDIECDLASLNVRVVTPNLGSKMLIVETWNKNRDAVSVRDCIDSMAFKTADFRLPVILGITARNRPIVIDLTEKEHLLISGSTVSDINQGIIAIITSLLFCKRPSELKFILIETNEQHRLIDKDPLYRNLYESLEQHFLITIESEMTMESEPSIISDVIKASKTLSALNEEMRRRGGLFFDAGIRDIIEYNSLCESGVLRVEQGHKLMPIIVVAITEFSALTKLDRLVKYGENNESNIVNLAEKAGKLGIHLVIGTTRPDANVIKGTIKAKFSNRIAFKVSSASESRTIIDESGAEHLIGNGDMLYSNCNETIRIQCPEIKPEETKRIVEFIHQQEKHKDIFKLDIDS